MVGNNNVILTRMYNVRVLYAETDVLDFTILSSCTTDDKRTRKKITCHRLVNLYLINILECNIIYFKLKT